jgi:formate dehydrogenase major subunit
MEAKRRGATIIHVDPRFTRTSAVEDVHVPIRAGSDIAFLGGIIHYILENDRCFRDYVVHFTNAPAIIDEAFQDTEDLDGLFSGWDAEQHRYDLQTWAYRQVEKDEILQHPRSVFLLTRKHLALHARDGGGGLRHSASALLAGP